MAKVVSEFPRIAFNKIAFVGEAPGVEEERAGRPFIGASGQLLDRLLREAQIDRAASYVGNVFTPRPPNNRIETFFSKPAAIASRLASSDSLPHGVVLKMLKGELKPPSSAVLPWLSWPRHTSHGYLRPEYSPDLIRLAEELDSIKPNVIVALGATALWALCGLSAIGTYRGTPQLSTLLPGRKVLGTFHPAATLRDWSQRPIVLSDLLKAKRESASPAIEQVDRRIMVAECLEDVRRFVHDHLKTAPRFAFDVETAGGTITHLSLAPDATTALVIPFYTYLAQDNSTFSADEETQILHILKKLFEDPAKIKVAHNSLYDLTYLALIGIYPCNVEDTMFLHHAYQPELPKSLGFLASLYCDEGAWKTLRKTPQRLRNKADD